MRVRLLWLGILLSTGACAHEASHRPTEEGVRAKGGDSATLHVLPTIARGEYAEAEVLITELLKAGLLSGAKAELLRQRLREAQEQRAGPERNPPPVDPVWPIPNEPPQDEERTCGRMFPTYPLCEQLPDQYGFPSASSALEVMKRRLGQKGLTLHKGRPNEQGPCPGLGLHYNVRQNGGRVGSIVCCPCCVDTAEGAFERQKCRIVW